VRPEKPVRSRAFHVKSLSSSGVGSSIVSAAKECEDSRSKRRRQSVPPADDRGEFAIFAIEDGKRHAKTAPVF
jgi:hypothetical protein